jgi:hypothetical protein
MQVEAADGRPEPNLPTQVAGTCVHPIPTAAALHAAGATTRLSA